MRVSGLLESAREHPREHKQIFDNKTWRNLVCEI
nr:MAG TPA_asm: hypothetical protein [Caudoviricetes sp.]